MKKILPKILSITFLLSTPIFIATNCSCAPIISATAAIQPKQQNLLSHPSDELEIASFTFKGMTQGLLGKLSLKLLDENNNEIKKGQLVFGAGVNVNYGTIDYIFPLEPSLKLNEVYIAIFVNDVEIGRSTSLNISTTSGSSAKISIAPEKTTAFTTQSIARLASVDLTTNITSNDVNFYFVDSLNNVVTAEAGSLKASALNAKSFYLQWDPSTTSFTKELRIIAQLKATNEIIGRTQLISFSTYDASIKTTTIPNQIKGLPLEKSTIGTVEFDGLIPDTEITANLLDSSGLYSSFSINLEFEFDKSTSTGKVYFTFPENFISQDFYIAFWTDNFKVDSTNLVKFTLNTATKTWSQLLSIPRETTDDNLEITNKFSGGGYGVCAPVKDCTLSDMYLDGGNLGFNNLYLSSIGGYGALDPSYPSWVSPATPNDSLTNFVMKLTTSDEWTPVSHFYGSGAAYSGTEKQYYGFFSGCSAIEKIVFDFSGFPESSSGYTILNPFAFTNPSCFIFNQAKSLPSVWFKSLDEAAIAMNYAWEYDFRWLLKMDANGNKINEPSIRNIIIPDSIDIQDAYKILFGMMNPNVPVEFKNLVITESEAGITS